MLKCPHGIFTHSPVLNRCPWCFGQNDHNRAAVSVVGPGNGWLLRAGDPVCDTCGGPAHVCNGLIPSGMTHAQWRESLQQITRCHYCNMAAR